MRGMQEIYYEGIELLLDLNGIVLCHGCKEWYKKEEKEKHTMCECDEDCCWDW